MIRQLAELSATRLILLTSGDSPGDVARARQLGISTFLVKPLQQRELMEAILRVMGHEGDPEELVVAKPTASGRVTRRASSDPAYISGMPDHHGNLLRRGTAIRMCGL
jgi:DNA-binding NarL/FixJ family response regulator